MKSRPLAAVLARLIWLCMAPMVLLAVWLASKDLRKLEAEDLREASHLARSFSLEIDHQLEARVKALGLLASSPLADDPARWPELYREAQGFERSFGSHVILADEQRQMLFNTRLAFGTALPRLPAPSEGGAAQRALETGSPQVGDLVFGPVANLPLVAIAVPVLRAGQPTRLLITTLELGPLQERIERMALPEGWSASLRDGTGADLARRSPRALTASAASTTTTASSSSRRFRTGRWRSRFHALSMRPAGATPHCFSPRPPCWPSPWAWRARC